MTYGTFCIFINPTNNVKCPPSLLVKLYHRSRQLLSENDETSVGDK